MNAKSKLLVKYAEGVIEMNTTFAISLDNGRGIQAMATFCCKISLEVYYPK